MRPTVLITVGTMALVRTLTTFARGTIIGFIVSGVIAGVFFHVVESTAGGDDELRPPEFSDWFDNVLFPFGRFLATLAPLFIALAVDGAPLILALLGDPRSWFAELSTGRVILVAWLLLWPLLIVVAALTRSVISVYNPLIWWKFLNELGADYWLGAAAFYGVLAFEALVLRPALGRFDVTFIGPLVGNMAVLLALMARGRILGEVCRPHM
jgi:hypothetical protein